jgi:hypothetical protein
MLRYSWCCLLLLLLLLLTLSAATFAAAALCSEPFGQALPQQRQTATFVMILNWSDGLVPKSYYWPRHFHVIRDSRRYRSSAALEKKGRLTGLAGAGWTCATRVATL